MTYDKWFLGIVSKFNTQKNVRKFENISFHFFNSKIRCHKSISQIYRKYIFFKFDIVFNFLIFQNYHLSEYPKISLVPQIFFSFSILPVFHGTAAGIDYSLATENTVVIGVTYRLELLRFRSFDLSFVYSPIISDHPPYFCFSLFLLHVC